MLRKLQESDVTPLLRILQEPEVSRFWYGYDEARIRRDLLEDDSLVVLAITWQGEVIGAVQFSEMDEPEYRHAGIDLFLGAAHHGKGLGPEAIHAIVRHLFEERGHHRLVIDPAADNRKAIRAYEKVGFRRVGTLRQYERGPDGSWHDGLLMELIAEDYYREDYERVLSFWLGPLDEQGAASPQMAARWWKKDDAFDQEIRERFGEDYEAIVAGRKDPWLTCPRGRLAYIIVLDQFSRNMFRGSAKMYAADEKARAAAEEGIRWGMDRALGLDERIFFYMPLMHSEDLSHQERAVELFTALCNEQNGASKNRMTGALNAALQHRNIIKRWGRFPHRNEILGRPSTPEEIEFLKEPGSSF